MSLHVGSPQVIALSSEQNPNTNITPTVRTIKQKFSNINDDKIAKFYGKNFAQNKKFKKKQGCVAT